MMQRLNCSKVVRGDIFNDFVPIILQILRTLVDLSNNVETLRVKFFRYVLTFFDILYILLRLISHFLPLYYETVTLPPRQKKKVKYCIIIQLAILPNYKIGRKKIDETFRTVSSIFPPRRQLLMPSINDKDLINKTRKKIY